MAFAVSSVEDKVLNACHRLNAEAYVFQVKANKGMPLKHFIPCSKAEALMSVIRKGEHFGMAHEKANREYCSCHRSMTDAELMKYEHDPTYRGAHYRGDKHVLYPEFYSKAEHPHA